jgi:hypothetical protein
VLVGAHERAGCSVLELRLQLFDEVVNAVDEDDDVLQVELEDGLHSVFCSVLGNDDVWIVVHGVAVGVVIVVAASEVRVVPGVSTTVLVLVAVWVAGAILPADSLELSAVASVLVASVVAWGSLVLVGSLGALVPPCQGAPILKRGRRPQFTLDFIFVCIVACGTFRVFHFISSPFLILVILSLGLDLRPTWVAKELILALAVVRLVTLSHVLACSRRRHFLLRDLRSLFRFLILLLYLVSLCGLVCLLARICLLFLAVILILGKTW